MVAILETVTLDRGHFRLRFHNLTLKVVSNNAGVTQAQDATCMSVTIKKRILQISILVLLILLVTFQVIPQRVRFAAGGGPDLTTSIGWPFPFYEWFYGNGPATRNLFHLNCLIVDLGTMAIVLVSSGLSLAYISYQRTIQIADYLAVIVAISFVFTAYRSADGMEITLRHAMGGAPKASQSMALSILALAALALFSYTFTSIAFRVIGTRKEEISD